MKTSSSQFQIMVEFMEQHGDLNRPVVSEDSEGRMWQLWEKLTNILNQDGIGEPKDKERWKNVWSDFEGNIIWKSAHIHGADAGSEQPACRSALTDLEKRALRIIESRGGDLPSIKEAGLQISCPACEACPSSPVPEHSTSDSPQVSGGSHVQTLEQIVQSPIAVSPVTSAGATIQPRPPPGPTDSPRRSDTRPPRLSRRGFVFRQRRPSPHLNAPRRPVFRQSRVNGVLTQLQLMDQRWRILFQEISSEYRRLKERELEEKRAEREERRAEREERRADREERRAEREHHKQIARWPAIVTDFFNIAENFVDK